MKIFLVFGRSMNIHPIFRCCSQAKAFGSSRDLFSAKEVRHSGTCCEFLRSLFGACQELIGCCQELIRGLMGVCREFVRSLLETCLMTLWGLVRCLLRATYLVITKFRELLLINILSSWELFLVPCFPVVSFYPEQIPYKPLCIKMVSTGP